MMAQQTTDASANPNSTKTCTTVPKPATKGMRPCRPFAESGVISLNFLVDVADGWPGRYLSPSCMFSLGGTLVPAVRRNGRTQNRAYCTMPSNFFHDILY